MNENGYRFYSHEQTFDFHMLLALKALQIPLDEIKHYVNKRTPQSTIQLLKNKIHQIDDEIERMNQLKESILLRLPLIEKVANTETDSIFIQKIEEQYFRLEPISQVKGHATNYLTWHSLFTEENKHQLNESLYGQMVSKDKLNNHQYEPDHILIEVTKDYPHYFVKKAGKYVVGHKKGKVLDGIPLIEKLMEYIEEHHLEIDGNAYEFFIVDGFYASDYDERILEIQIPVK